jgi:hypothetical protein
VDPFAASVRSNSSSSSTPASGSSSGRASNSECGPHLGCAGAVSLLPIVSASSAGVLEDGSVLQHLEDLLHVTSASTAGTTSSSHGASKMGSAFGSCIDVLANSCSGSSSVSGGKQDGAAASGRGSAAGADDGLAQLETLMQGHPLD